MKLQSDKERMNDCGRRQSGLIIRRKSAPNHVGGYGLVVAPRHNGSRAESGSSLIVTLVIGVMIIIVLMSYLQLLEGRTITRTRSLAWNSAIPILEAGIEEACTQLNEYSLIGSTLACNGWTNSVVNTHNLYSKRRDFADGSYCLVTISNVDTLPPTTPVVLSQGFVPGPYQDGYISRTVQVRLTNSPAFTRAIAAKGMVDLSGQAVVDSFDSSSTNYSTGGAYDSSKRKSNGSVVTNSKGNPAIDVGNGHIYGTTDNGPGGTVASNSGGTVGDATWSATHSGVEPGYSNDDMNATYPDQSAPSGSSSWLPLNSTVYLYVDPTTLAVTTYDYQMGNVNRTYNGDFTMGSHDTMVVTGNATLYITGSFRLQSGSYIYIAPGASLTVYVKGSTTRVTGQGIINATGKASNFTYIGLPTNTSIQYAGGADFIGTINAPEADMSLTGGANMVGAAIVNTYTSKSSGVGFHFDESIVKQGPLKMCDYKEL